jgi:hypothetical protein
VGQDFVCPGNTASPLETLFLVSVFDVWGHSLLPRATKQICPTSTLLDQQFVHPSNGFRVITVLSWGKIAWWLFLCNALLLGTKRTFKPNLRNTLIEHMLTLKGMYFFHTKLYIILWYWAQLILPKFNELRWNGPYKTEFVHSPPHHCKHCEKNNSIFLTGIEP